MDVLDDVGFRPPPPSTCDQCGPSAIAYLFAEVNGTELSFCGSCGTRHYDKLERVGRITLDRRDEIRA